MSTKRKDSPLRQDPRLSGDAEEILAYRILTINPGSMSTKVALFEQDRCLHDTEVTHEVPSIASLEARKAQIEHRMRMVLEMLAVSGIDRVDAIVSRGGFLRRPVGKLAAGTYIVAERLGGKIVVDEGIVAGVLEDPEMDHASNLGIPVAASLAVQLQVPAFVVDPVVVDEFPVEAEISGYPSIVRRSTAHALSVHAAARQAAEQIGRSFDTASFVVAHMGGGITVAAVRRGKMVDNNIALLGGGPFTPRRVGHLDVSAVMELCYSGRFTRDELAEELTTRAGLCAYLGEHRMEVIEERIAAGDEKARVVSEAMVYQIAKEIGAMVVAAGAGQVDAIVLTGGLAHSKFVVSGLERLVGRLAPFVVFPGSLEMTAMARGAIAVLAGRQEPRRYEAPARPRG
ncbi:MAG: butyrate kinase [Phycisphaerae bacterium]|nr:butyrate kinase [Phycisphaerae bacterium]